ncbi:MAG: hypothetical protein M3424_01900 [Actinomycetota bacterium]|nr:hypothetical protein [Actinomycetota bacterium]
MARISHLLLISSVSAALVAGCGTTTAPTGAEGDQATTTTTTTNSGEVVVLEQGTRIATIESPDDLTSWGSYLLRVVATGECERNVSPLGPGEELVGREVTVRVEEVLWAHPDALGGVSDGQVLPVYTFPGYLRSNGLATPAAEEGDLRMEIGGRYVIAMADDVTPEGEQTLTLLGTFPTDDDGFSLSDGTDLEFSTVSRALDQSVEDAPSNSGPRPGESLVERLERYSGAP